MTVQSATDIKERLSAKNILKGSLLNVDLPIATIVLYFFKISLGYGAHYRW